MPVLSDDELLEMIDNLKTLPMEDLRLMFDDDYGDHPPVPREEALALQVGDRVFHSVIPGNGEVIKTIEHQTHGIRNDKEDYCQINGKYWCYDHIIRIDKCKR